MSILGFVSLASKSTTEQPFPYAERQSKKITVTVFAEKAKTRTGKGLAPVIFLAMLHNVKIMIHKDNPTFHLKTDES